MHIAIVIFRYFPFGGLQRDMLAIAQEAIRRGHAVTVFCEHWQGDVIAGINLIKLRPRSLFNTAGVKGFVNAFTAHYDARQFDVLIGFNKMPGLDIYYCGDSCFAQKANAERSFLYRLTPRAQLYLRYEEAVYSHLSKTHILEVSAAERPLFAKYYATPNERQTLLPPGIDPQLILTPSARATARAALRKHWQLDDSAYLILCAGSGFKTKGLDRSLRSFACARQHNPQAHLIVVGNGDQRPFQSLVKTLGIAQYVHFLGGRDDMASIYAACDLLLHPAYKEVTGNVIVEAMVCGLPVLATEACGYAHYVTEFAMGQLLSAPDNPHRVAQQIAAVAAVTPTHWQQQAETFAQHKAIFSRPAQAVSEIEQLAQKSPELPRVKTCGNRHWILCDELREQWAERDVFALLEHIQGDVARAMPDRQTLRFSLQSNHYYRKWHRGVGWREIAKNLLQGRLPVLGAKNEWVALNKLRALGIPSLTPLAYGVKGKNPARQQSFIVTRELQNVVQLDHYLEQHTLQGKTRRALIDATARIVRQLHWAGVNHRDLYLCHFMLKPDSLAGAAPELYLIDLHRAQCRAQVPLRWQIKDLAALYYSTLNMGFNQRDIFRFLRGYFERPLRDILQQTSLLNKIRKRALSIYRRDYGHNPASFY